jgi:putative hemolysin
MSVLLPIIVGALLVSALCSLLESVLLSLSNARIAELEEQERRSGPLLAAMRNDPGEPVAAILVLNTVAQTAGAIVAGALAYQQWGAQWITLFTVLLTLAVLVLAEILPRAVGGRYAADLAEPAAHVLHGLTRVMRPVILPLGWLRRLVVPAGESPQRGSRAELEALAEIGWREGALDEEEWEVVTNMMNLDQLVVADVMTPRTSVVAIPVEASVEDAKDLVLAEGHLRIPVYEGNLDRMVGVLLARDLWRADREGITEIRPLLRRPTFVPQTKPVEDLIGEMRRGRIRLAVVIDEYGGTAGLVTLEDLIEEIIGEIPDEHDQEPLPFEEEMEGEVRIRGDVPLWEVNERFDLELPEEVFDTIGGYVFGQLGRIAEVGDQVEAAGGRFRVVAMAGRRVDRVAFIRDGTPPE